MALTLTSDNKRKQSLAFLDIGRVFSRPSDSVVRYLKSERR